MLNPENAQSSELIVSDAVIIGTLFHPSLASSVLLKFSEEWFSLPELRAIFRAAKIYFERFRETPQPETLSKFIRLEGLASGDLLNQIEGFLSHLPRLPETNFLEYQLEKILQGKVLSKTIRDAAALYQQGDYDEAFRLFGRAKAETYLQRKQICSYWEDWELRSIEVHGDPSPTGFMSLDSILGGGLFPGEMMLVIGAKSSGKSWFAVWAARAALFYNKFYALVTMEMSRGDFLRRIDCAVANYDFNRYNLEDVRDIIMRKREALGGNVTILEYPSGQPTVARIENDLLEVEQKMQRKIDCVIIDYLDLMRGAVITDSSTPRFGLISTSVEIRGMCGRNNFAAIVLKQSNALGKKRPFIEAENAAEAFGTTWAPDFIISINEVTGQPDRRRLYISDSRRTSKKIAIPYIVDFHRAQWVEISQ